MKEKEALRILGDTTLCTPLGQASFVAIEAIKKLQQYEEIGTVSECREAVEKQRAKKPILNDKANVMFCPICERKVKNNYDLHCSGCGQAIDWGDEP